MSENLDEAVGQLKAELLAPDWRLNERRALRLLDALAVVAGSGPQRLPLLQIGGMARAAVEYLRPRGAAAPPAVLDFLKLVLAKLVRILEEDEPELSREVEVAQQLYTSFCRLKSTLAGAVGRE